MFSVEATRCHFSVLGEDVIALMLLAEVKDLQKSSNVSEILNRLACILQQVKIFLFSFPITVLCFFVFSL